MKTFLYITAIIFGLPYQLCLAAIPDTTPPTILNLSNPHYTHLEDVTLSWEAADPESGIKECVVSYSDDGGGTYQVFYTGVDSSASFRGLEGRFYLFRITATNNAELSATADFPYPTLIDLTTPLISISTSPIGSTAEGKDFGVTIRAQDLVPGLPADGLTASGLQKLDLTILKDGSQVKTLEIEPVGAGVLRTYRSGELEAMLSENAPAFTFEDGRLYEFRLQAFDRSGNASGLQIRRLRVDNGMPQTDSLFTTILTQSFSNQTDWRSGVDLQNVNVKRKPDWVLLDGPEPVLSQPGNEGEEGGKYLFNQGLDASAEDLPALTEPSYPMALTIINSGRAVRFAEGSGTNNLVPGAYTGGFAYTYGVQHDNKHATDYFAGSNGSAGYVYYSNRGGSLDEPYRSIFPYPSPNYIFDGNDASSMQFCLRGEAAGDGENSTGFMFERNFDGPITVDRLKLSALAQACGNYYSLSVGVGLKLADGGLLMPNGIQRSGTGPIGWQAVTIYTPYRLVLHFPICNDINLDAPPLYNNNTQLLKPAIATGIRVWGSAILSNSGGSLSRDALVGPLVYLREVGAMEPSRDMNPILEGVDNPNAYIVKASSGSVTQGDPKFVYDFEERSESEFVVMAPTATPTPTPTEGSGGWSFSGGDEECEKAYAEVSRDFGRTIDVNRIILTGAYNAGSNWSSSCSEEWSNRKMFLRIATSDTNSFEIDISNLSGQWAILYAANILQRAGLPIPTGETQENVVIPVRKIAFRMEGSVGNEFHFHDLAVYGRGSPLYVANAAPQTFVSPIFDLEHFVSGTPEPFTLNWTADVPGGTDLRISARTGKDAGAFETDPEAGYAECQPGSELPGLDPQWGDRFFQYRVVMRHDVPDKSPVLRGVVLQKGEYQAEGTWTSPPMLLGDFNPLSGMKSVVSWRSMNPTGAGVDVGLQTSGTLEGDDWGSTVALANGGLFDLDPGVERFRFVARLHTDDPLVSPELSNLDFGFKSEFPVIDGRTFIVSGSRLFLMPLDGGSGVRRVQWGLSEADSEMVNDYDDYITPRDLSAVVASKYRVAYYGTDHTDNVENPPSYKDIEVSTLAIKGIGYDDIVNRPVTLSVELGPGMVLNPVVLTRVNRQGTPLPTPAAFHCGPGSGENPQVFPCLPVLEIGVDGIWTVRAEAVMAGVTIPVDHRFEIDMTPPSQPTGLTVTRGGSCPAGRVCLDWDDNTIDKDLKGYIIRRDGTLLMEPELAFTASELDDNPGDERDHFYEVYAVDRAKNVSPPAFVSTAPGNWLVSDAGNQRVFELDLEGEIQWIVQGDHPGEASHIPGLFRPISANRIYTSDHSSWGNTLLVDGNGVLLADTTEYPPYVPTATPTFTPRPESPSPTPWGTWEPESPTATPTMTPDPRYFRLFDTSLPESTNDILEAEVAWDGGFIVASKPKPGGEGSGSVVKFSPQGTPLWSISGLVSPSSVRDLKNGHVLIADEGANQVMEVDVTAGNAIDLNTSTVWKADQSSNGLASPYEAVRGMSGRYYIADTGNDRVLVLDPDRELRSTISTTSGVANHLSGPRGIVELDSGNIVVADTENDRLLEFSPSESGPVLTYTQVSEFTDVHEPYEVRQMPGVFRMEAKPETDGPAFAWHPYVLSATVTDSRGQPVPGYPVLYETDWSGQFLDPVYFPPAAFSRYTVAPAGQQSYIGGIRYTTVTTDADGRARITYFPTDTGNHPITVSSANTRTSVFYVPANQPLPAPERPVIREGGLFGFVGSVFNSLIDIGLYALSTVTNLALKSIVPIPLTVNFSRNGVEFGVGFDSVQFGINTRGDVGAGFKTDGATFGYNTGTGASFSWAQQPGGPGAQLNWNRQAGFSTGVSNGQYSFSLNENGASFGFMPGDPSGPVGFRGVNIGIGEGGNPWLGVNMNSFDVVASRDAGFQVDINERYIGEELGEFVYRELTQPPSPRQTVTIPAAEKQSQGGVPCSTDANAGQVASAGSNPVILSNGQLSYSSVDLFIPGPGPVLDLEVIRTYNNLSDFTGSFGPRWHFEYDTFLIATPLTWEIVFGDGHREVFVRNPDGETAEPWSGNHTAELRFYPEEERWVYSTKIGMEYSFDRNGLVTEKKDRWGNQVAFEYDEETKLLSKVRDAAGRELSFQYTSATGQARDARLTRITDPAGREFEYQYNTEGELTTVVLPEGRQIHYTYDRDHLLATRMDPAQSQGVKYMSYRYDDKNRVARETDGMGYATRFEYSLEGTNGSTTFRTRVVDARDNPSAYEFDHRQNLVREEDPMGGARTYTYDDFGNRLTATNALGRTIRFGYDANDNLVQVVDAKGNTTSYTYVTPYNVMTSLTDARNRTWTFEYDDKGNMVRTADPLSHDMLYTYDPHGDILTCRNARGYTTELVRDPYGNCVVSRDALGHEAVFGFDVVGRRTSVADPSGHLTQYQYDGEDRLVRITYHDQSYREYIYDGRGNLQTEKDENGHAIGYSYDSSDRMTPVQFPCGGAVERTYDGNGNVVTETDRGGHLWVYAYDANNRVMSVSNEDAGTQTFEYDLNGNRTKWTDGEGRVTVGEYDANNRLVKAIDSAGHSLATEWDELGRVSRSTDKNGNATRYAYDDAGQLDYVTDAMEGIWDYTHDENGNLTSLADPLAHAVTYEYDENDRVKKVTRQEGDTKEYTYNENGRWHTAQVTGCTCGTKTYTYDGRNRVATILDEAGHLSRYEYDAVGNLTKFTDARNNTRGYQYDSCNNAVTVTGPVGDVTGYQYDAMGRVTRLKDAEGGVQQFQYDSAGRLTGITDAEGGVSSFQYNKNGQIVRSADPNGHATRFKYDELGYLVKKTDALGSETRYQNDPMGMVTKATDANGNATRYKYDALTRVVKVVDAEDGVRRNNWDAGSRLTSVTDENGNKTTYRYDKNNRRIRRKDPLDAVRKWEYDGRDNVTKVVDENGHATVNEYDVLGRLVKVTDANGGQTSFGYDEVGNRVSQTDANGNVSTMEYNAANRLKTVTDPLGNKTTYKYDKMYRRIQTKDAKGYKTKYRYDKNHLLVKQVDAESGVTKHKYDGVGDRVKTTDPNGNSTRYQYDPVNRLVKVLDVLGGEITYEYDPVGNRVKSTDQNGHSTTFAYDKLNRLTATTDAEGGVTANKFDAVGNLLKVTDAQGSVVRHRYDAGNRRLRTIDPNGGVTRFHYDPVGLMTRMTDANGNATRYRYDPVNRLRFVTNAEDHATEYRYDPAGNKTAIVDANGHETRFGYDELNRLVSERDAVGNETTFTYDAVGNQATKTDSKGTRTMEYDGNRRLIRKNLPDGKREVYEYDDAGRRTKVTDWNGIYRFEYDSLNRLVKKAVPDGRSITSGYDAAGNVTEKTDFFGGNYQYQYDRINRPVLVMDSNHGLTGITYDRTGHVLQYHHPNKTSINYTYDLAYNILSVFNVKDSGDVISKHVYRYDAVGNRLSVDDNIGKTGYGYDKTYQLTRVDYPDRADVTYAYDPVGNRLRMLEGTTVTDYSYNDANMIMTAGSERFEFDQNGNMTKRFDVRNRETTVYRYDTENRLTEVIMPDRSNHLFGYDYTNMRITADVPGEKWVRDVTKYYWDRNDVVNEQQKDAQVSYNVVRGINLSKTNLCNSCPTFNTIYYHFDGLGNVSSLSNYSTDIVTTYTYNVNGLLNGTNDYYNRLRYTGAYGAYSYDEPEFIYVRNRWYFPRSGNFISKDPIGELGGINLYMYCQNNAVNFSDPFGLWLWGGTIQASGYIGVAPIFGATAQWTAYVWSAEGYYENASAVTKCAISTTLNELPEDIRKGDFVVTTSGYAGTGVGAFITSADTKEEIQSMTKQISLGIGAGWEGASLTIAWGGGNVLIAVYPAGPAVGAYVAGQNTTGQKK